jgi:tetratricopeptide (TPR) repeat protein
LVVDLAAVDCPGDNALQELAEGVLAPELAEALAAHIDACSVCRRAVSALMRTSDGSVEPAADSSPVVRIGRFEIEGVLGSGGMGIVYKAYDPDLGRAIALKMVRTSSSEAAGRQKREARAMAQISHPNVVAIHDVGTHDGELFLVMELIAGTTLAEWLRASERNWRDQLAMFVAAGRGLAAAHAAGLVHRDFKPHNVLVGEDGRARVTDFGLAREQAATGTDVSAIAETTPGVAVSPLTSAGRVMGTPAYMAPEQHLGAAADARSDQFAFAIALWEALHDERPFAGATVAAIGAEVVAGRLRAPHNRDVPRYVQRALVRSLAADPARRWPSMDALLRALTTDPRRTWRRAAIALASAAVVAAAVVTWGRVQASRARSEAAATCALGDDALAGIWDDARKHDVQRALLATRVPFASDAWQRVATGLDRYAAAWRATRVRACEDTHVRGTASEAVLDRREHCLWRRQLELRALVDALATTDAKGISRGTTAVNALERVEGCLDDESSATEPVARAKSWDPALDVRVATLWARYAKAKTWDFTGRYHEAAAEAGAILPAAKELAFAPLTARVASVVGHAVYQLGDLAKSREYLTLAAAEAERAHDETLRLMMLTALISSLEDGEHDEELARWTTVVRAGIMGLDPSRRCAIAVSLEDPRLEVDEPAAAVAQAQEAVKLCEAVVPADDDELSDALGELGGREYMAGHVDAAIADLERALVLAERARGADHPDNAALHVYLASYQDHPESESARLHLGRALEILDRNHLENVSLESALSQLASLYAARGEYAKSLTYARRAGEVATRIYGSRSMRGGWALMAEALANTGLGQLDEAMRLTRAARALFVASGSNSAINVASADSQQGEILALQGRTREALARLEPAFEVLNAHEGDKADAAVMLAWIGDLEALLGHHEVAMARYRTALEMLDKSPSVGDDLLGPLTGLGELLVAQGRATEAVQPLERALAQIGTRPLEPAVIARTRFALARALWQTGDRARALDLAHTARDAYRGTTYPHARELAAVDSWLAGKPAH